MFRFIFTEFCFFFNVYCYVCIFWFGIFVLYSPMCYPNCIVCGWFPPRCIVRFVCSWLVGFICIFWFVCSEFYFPVCNLRCVFIRSVSADLYVPDLCFRNEFVRCVFPRLVSIYMFRFIFVDLYFPSCISRFYCCICIFRFVISDLYFPVWSSRFVFSKLYFPTCIFLCLASDFY